MNIIQFMIRKICLQIHDSFHNDSYVNNHMSEAPYPIWNTKKFSLLSGNALHSLWLSSGLQVNKEKKHCPTPMLHAHNQDHAISQAIHSQSQNYQLHGYYCDHHAVCHRAMLSSAADDAVNSILASALGSEVMKLSALYTHSSITVKLWLT